MISKILPAVVVLAALASPAAAQQDPQQAPNPHRPQTDWKPVDQSLTDLLNSGYRVVSSMMALTAPVVVIEKNGHFVMCGIHTPGGLTGGPTATSDCNALN